MLIISVFANNTILSCCVIFVLIIYFLIPAVTGQIYNPAVALVMPIGIPTKEAKEK